MFKKIHFFTEYVSHYFRKYFPFLLIGSLIGSFLFFQRAKVVNFYQFLLPQNTSIGIEGLYTLNSLPSNISELISFGLTSSQEDGHFSPSPLIESLNLQDNNLSYIFTFRKNLFWHNGNKFDAHDINFNIPDAEISVASDHEITIKTKNVYAPLASILSKPLFFKKTLIGLGPYQVSSTTYQDGYLKTLVLISTPDKRQRITYRFYSDSSDLINAFKLGEVNQITTNSLDNNLVNWPKIKISQQILTNKYIAIFLNTEKLNNKSLRQSLAYATPKTTDKNDRCLGPISPTNWAYNAQIKEYNFNPAKAKELFENNKIDHLNLIVGDSKLLDQANDIKNNLESILGIKVDLTVQNQQIDTNNYEAILTYGLIPSDPDQYSFWHSTQNKTNITHFNNSRIDKLLEEGRLTFDEQERKRIYYDFQRFLLEESPVIFIKFPTTYTYSRIK